MIRIAAARDGAALEWRKSSFSSNGPEGDCVEAAITEGAVHVRDSKNADGPLLTVTPQNWSSFVAYASEC
ncbi:DUF397 domain-containing protein [Streptomyces somaliensis DSM 40738]|uniref:DUF397 domain-containing protein n=1 Tax=Streptomyces somaliensis (strain ATCC 33201 / DSM 40738 / JCM 12659 / KCTC 9044 / NCTC 11332 / NRRL B-12077 / IP 733) TaxID=1134445 RepID=A0AA44DBR3_STRE0|nr:MULTISPECIES: DUF397 domain-containing protein [Streptomyces]MCQ0024163.1 DUF397 domain-containing protein [Streptomyces somaliensis DSM 40738]NKY13455.1 DUF397 domain-containing protein [Streptomyces somaliensis DSM 40738]URM90059.1 DUF397 domain-containing protein [Streptomyces sp. MRC013]